MNLAFVWYGVLKMISVVLYFSEIICELFSTEAVIADFYHYGLYINKIYYETFNTTFHSHQINAKYDKFVKNSHRLESKS